MRKHKFKNVQRKFFHCSSDRLDLVGLTVCMRNVDSFFDLTTDRWIKDLQDSEDLGC